MFGSVFTMRPRPGEAQATEAMFHRWQQERAPRTAGVVASYILKSKTHPGEMIGLAVFDSEANYRKNAEDPDQDRWYRELRALLEADPTWNDGEVIQA